MNTEMVECAVIEESVVVTPVENEVKKDVQKKPRKVSENRVFIYNGKKYKSRPDFCRTMFRLGVPIKNIAEKANVSYNAVYVLRRTDEMQGKKYRHAENVRTKAKKHEEEILKMYNSSVSVPEIAKKLKMTYPAIRYHLKKANIEIVQNFDHERAIEMYKIGINPMKISKELDVTYARVMYVLKKEKLYISRKDKKV